MLETTDRLTAYYALFPPYRQTAPEKLRTAILEHLTDINERMCQQGASGQSP
jgi:hypothetical protein